MKITKCLKHAFNMVLHSKLRSWLTILGIVIGVAAVIAIMSLGAGLTQSVNNQLGNLGGDILTLSAGFERGGNVFVMRGAGGSGGDFGGGGAGQSATTKTPTLGNQDVQALRSVPEVLMFDTEIRGNVKITYLGKTGSVSLTGVDPKVWSQITTSTVAQGRLLGPTDTNVIVIGGRLASSYFSKPLGINQMVSLNGSAFRVVGVLNDQSTSIYMPIQMAYQMLPTKDKGVYDSIIIKMRNQDMLNETITAITDRLMILRHVTDKTKDFSISSNAQIQATRASMMSSINIFLLAIAAVSLIVGAIGIANTLFTSVLEKTKEIGIMKAIGARNKDILLIFLFNAALIGLVGGLLGVILGTILSGALPSLMGDASMITRGGTLVTLNSVILALSVSIGVGILAGMIPAYQASRLKPVDALRFE